MKPREQFLNGLIWLTHEDPHGRDEYTNNCSISIAPEDWPPNILFNVYADVTRSSWVLQTFAGSYHDRNLHGLGINGMYDGIPFDGGLTGRAAVTKYYN